MSTRMRDAMLSRLTELRYEPTEKRVRAVLGGQTVVDTTRAVLVWEPRRVVPSYAVPVDEVRAALVESTSDRPDDGRPVLHPGIPFAVHSTPGKPYGVRLKELDRDGAAFRPADAALDGLVVLDFRAFDAWFEEDDPIHSHPRDPYHRVDVRPSSRQVRVELNGELLAESTRPTLVFETSLPTRFYLPREDVRTELLPSDRVTYCPYKGRATYWSTAARPHLLWTYREPLPDAVLLAGLVAFFDELVDVTVDGVPRPRTDTDFAKAIVEESGM
jgi:uncharacterized protein (DUF427 family)